MVKVLKEVPDSTRGKVDWTEVAEAARKNPGLWVEVPVPLSSGMSTQIKRRMVRAIDPDEFDITTRKNPGVDSRTFYVRVAER